MLKHTDILQAVKDVIKKYNLNATIYFKETTEGYSRPCYFIDVLPVTKRQEMYGVYNISVLIVISYFSNTNNSIENMDILDNLTNTFCGVLQVLNRVLIIEEFQIEEVGGNNREFNLTFNLQYKDVLETKEENTEIARDLSLKIKNKEVIKNGFTRNKYNI